MRTDPPKENPFYVPEPPSGVAPGFLTEYWLSQDPLPTLRKLEYPWYFLQRGFKSMIALPLTNAITVATFAISLFLLAGFLLLLKNVDRVISDAGSSLFLTLYIKEDASKESVASFVHDLENNRRVRSVDFISKEKALQQFREDLGSRGGFLDGLEDDNPLPPSVDIVLHPDELGLNRVESFVDEARKSPVVDDLVYGSEWVDRMQRILKFFRFGGFVSLFLALGVVVFLIANTIKLVIFSRRDEVSIMQLVGSSDAFVKVPFVIAGVLQGFLGAIIGLCFLDFAFLLLNSQVQQSSVLGVTIPSLLFLDFSGVLAIILVGIFVGAVGSFFALGRFMKV